MNAGVQRRAEKRWLVNHALAFFAYGIVVVGIPAAIAWRFGDYSAVLAWPASARIALALAPMAPIAYSVYSFVAFYRSRDELQRRKLAEATIASALIVGLATFAWGWLALADVLPPLHSLWTLPALCATFCAALWFVDRRYR